MGAVQILSHSMVQSIEENSVRKGFDPRDFALVAEGGAGPLFAVPIAIEVGTPHVVVPPYPGICAAMGLLATDMVYEYVGDDLSAALEARCGCAAVTLRGARGAGRRPSSTRTGSDGRSRRHPAHRRVPLSRPGLRAAGRRGSASIDDVWVEKLRADFHDIHEREYSRRFEDSDIEVPNIRVRGIGLMPELATPEVEAGDESPDEALRHEGEAWFRVDGSLEQVPTRYYEREALRGRQPSRGAGDRQPVRLDDGDPAGRRGACRPVREHRHRGRRLGRGARAVAATATTAEEDVSMSTLEYELGKHPGPPERERVDVDPITMRVLGGAFHAIAKEMAGVLFRMSYSSIIRESEDLGAGIFDAQGPRAAASRTRRRCTSARCPGTSAASCARLEGKIVEGDVIVHNHPYLGASHTPDIAVAVPIFWEGELIGFAAVTGARARRRRLVPGHQRRRLRHVRRGEDLRRAPLVPSAASSTRTLDRMIFDNVRTETMNRGDMRRDDRPRASSAATASCGSSSATAPTP